MVLWIVRRLKSWFHSLCCCHCRFIIVAASEKVIFYKSDIVGAEIPAVPAAGATASAAEGEQRKPKKVVYENKKKKKPQPAGLERQESDTTKEGKYPYMEFYIETVFRKFLVNANT